MALARKRGRQRIKMTAYSPSAQSTAVRQALFPTRTGSYPRHIAPLNNLFGIQSHTPICQQIDILSLSNNRKCRDVDWSTSSPAEYVLQGNRNEYQQILVYAGDSIQRQELMNGTDASLVVGAEKSSTKCASLKENISRNSGFFNEMTTVRICGNAEDGLAEIDAERVLLKHAMLREELVLKLHKLIKAATPAQSLLRAKSLQGSQCLMS